LTVSIPSRTVWSGGRSPRHPTTRPDNRDGSLPPPRIAHCRNPAALLLVLLSSACQLERPIGPQADAQPRMLNNVSAPQSLKRVRTSDDDLAELADRLPGFGGFYYDGQQRLNVWLKDPGRSAEAEVQVADLLRRRTGRARDRSEDNAARVQGMRVRQAQYDFRQLLTWYRGHVLPNVMRLEGITMTDINEQLNRIQVGVANAALVEPTRRRIARLPIPNDVVQVIVEPLTVPTADAVHALTPSDAGFRTQYLQGIVRPVVGGARIIGYIPNGGGAGNTCTLGFNLVAWVSDTLRPERYFVTNSHCLPGIGSMGGNAVAQPAASSFVGVETLDPSNLSCVTVVAGVVVPNSPCRLADAALVLYDSASFSDHGKVAVPAVGETSFTSTTSITEVYSPEVGRGVEMIGSESGRKTGTVTRSCVNIQSTDNIWYLCQGRASYAAQGNDSGSPVIERLGDGSVAYGVGLHWGTSSTFGSAFSPLYSVLNDLYSPAIGLLDPTTSPSQAPVLPSPPTAFELAVYGMTLVGPMTECTWSAVVTGGEAPFEYTWSGLLSGSSADVYGSMTTSGYLQVVVVDALGVQRTASILIDFDPEAELYCM